MYLCVGVLSMYLCVGVVSFASFYVFSIGLWNCSDSVVYFVLFLELFRQCGITCFRLWNCSDSVVYFVLDFGTVPTEWYILF